MRKNVLIIYDISSDRERDMFAKEMLLFGIRTQKSVFEAELTEREIDKVRKIIKNYKSFSKTSKIDIYTIDSYAYQKALRFGKNSDYLAIDDLII